MYFVTACTSRREMLFGEVLDGKVRLNDAGRRVERVWAELPLHYASAQTDAFIVMPNHVHGIIVLHRPAVVGAGLKPAPTRRHGLPEIMRGFKTFSARRVNELRPTSGTVWQRGYYEHVIRSGEVLDCVRRYIAENPARWGADRENPLAADPESEAPWRRLA